MGKKSRKVDFFDDTEEAAADTKENVDAADAPAPKKAGKKGKKKGKASKDDWPDSDDGSPAPVGDSDDVGVPAAKPKKAASKASDGGRKGSAFALLAGDDDDDDAAISDGADADDAPSAMPGSVVVAMVTSVSKHPKADRLMVCSVSTGDASHQVVTNALDVRAGMLVAFAPAGVTTPGSNMAIEATKMRGVDSAGMLCSAYDVGWASEADGVLLQLPAGCEPGEPLPAEPIEGSSANGLAKKPSKKKKSSKGGDSVDNAFAALGLDDEDDAEVEEEAPVVAKPAKSKKKKSSKGGDSVDNAFAALGLDDEDDAEVEEEAPVVAKPAKSKKKKASKGGDSVDNAFAALGLDDEDDAEVEAPPPPPSKPAKQSKSKQSRSAAEEAEIDALMAELDAPKPAKASKKKKKGGAKDAGEEEDLDALLAEFGVEVTDTKAEGGKKKKGKAKEESAPAEAPVEAAAEAQQDDEGKDDGEDGKGGEMSAAAKKKAKKKAREKAKKAAHAEADEEEEETIESLERAGKKIPAAKRRMLEAIAAKRAAEEAARREAEEAARREEEEARRAEEEEARKREEAERRKEAKRLRKEELRKAGLLLTAKQKEEARRLEAERQRLLKQAQEAGLALPEEPVKKKRPIYTNKKRQPKKETDSKEDTPREADTPTAAEAPVEAMLAAEEPPAVEEAPPAAEEPAPMEEESEGDDWEAMDVDAIKLPHEIEEEQRQKEEAAKKAAAEEAARKAAEAQRAREEAKAAAAAAAKAAPAVEEAASEDASDSNYSEEDESDEESDEDESDEDESDEDESDEDDSDDDSYDSEEEREERRVRAKAKRQARWDAAMARRVAGELRSPICCILGHVDTGKTKLLDNIRRTNVQEGEAGGITQQIGATYIPADAIKKRTAELHADGVFDIRFPALLVIDTPGHESFTNLRTRGSGLCDMAILVVDLMHGLEQQTIESINLLKMRKTPFIVALNKVDRLFDWQSRPDAPFEASFKGQKDFVRKEFDQRYNQVKLQLNEQGLNVALFWENPDIRKYVNIVPTSAVTGEGIPDMLNLLVDLTQRMLGERLSYVDELQCTVLEVKVIEGLGTTVDVVLVNGTLREGDTIVLCGLGGPIVTTVRSLLTPHPLKELRVKGSYLHHKEIRAAQGVKIAAHGLEHAVAGTQLFVLRSDDDVEDVKAEVMEDMQDVFASVQRTGEGVCVQASTLGSLEALLEFLKSPDVNIPVSEVNLGPVHKRDVMRASVMLERGAKKYACILAFDVPVTREARDMAEGAGVKIFTADIIYHLFDQFTAYLKQVKEEEQQAALQVAVFPCTLKILPTCVFNKRDPIVLGVEVVEGICRVGTPICVPGQGFVDLGKIASLELNHKPVDQAKKGDSVAMKIEATTTTESTRAYGRHFDHKDELVSRISRKSIDALKENFRDELAREDWQLVVKLKHMFQIN